MTERRLVLHFPPDILDQPIIYKLVKDYDLVFNILKASIIPEKEGILVLEIRGDRGQFEKGIQYLEQQNVRIEPLSEDIVRREERCTHCGLCTIFCPSGALSLERGTMRVLYDPEQCVACLECLDVCPTHAIESTVK